MSAILLSLCTTVRAQFSPGALSTAHAALDGPNNCTGCHDVGREIAGAKCLTCHTEIATVQKPGGGFHPTVTARQNCVDCHKEHLGRDAKTFAFDPEMFDHDLTGYLLSGKHAAVKCEDCHTGKFIRRPVVKDLIAKYPHRTYLGLETKCADCHEDAHKGKFGADCATCHAPTGWKDVASFDHSRTKFALTGRHSDVKCKKCHTSEDAGGKTRFAAIPDGNYSDCTPCHASEHRTAVVKNECRSCHDPAGWNLAMTKPFDHNLTRYEPRGGHAKVDCEKCHKPGPGKTFLQTFRRPYAQCVDCHTDRHNGAFTATYRNDCSACHTLNGYSPSTFTFASHQKSPWPLTGVHMAVLCADCHHRGAATVSWQFRFSGAGCESCHKDVHGGQFAVQMKDSGCGSCHQTTSWRPAVFQHLALTGFALEGKHSSASCKSCHKEITAEKSAGMKSPGAGNTGMKFLKLSTTCGGCHSDPHQAQFASGGASKCEGCHAPTAWAALRFDHETRSSFSLKGGHSAVKCAECHARETSAGAAFTRYKPVSAKCESCHQGGKPR